MINTADKLVNFKTIYCSSNSIIYKAFNLETNEKVIIKTLNRELYNSASLLKLKNEYRLLTKLKSDYVVKVYEFLNVENRFSIAIEDFDAISLDQYLRTNQIGLREFLFIALETAKCLDHLHKNQVIHKDINPSNIVYNPDSQVIKLIDFGISSEFSFETMQAINPHKLEGRLPYISPEQTGRMNRPVDYRTDFYSLGVTLYELACRQLPFVSDDSSEIVHCHIARNPRPAHQANPEIPKNVSAIISKLMGKMPEERYKNAQGIIFDLHTCIEQLDNSGTVGEFPLGSRDIVNRFEVPKKLYGRKNELENLLTSFASISRGNSEFILIGGYSGIGKTALVNELHKPVIKEHGIFISGKYDQFNRNTPYSACFQAIDQFCSYILSEPEQEIERWKKRITDALGSNGKLITEAVPRLSLIIGEQPDLGELSALEEQTRFKIALKNWLAAISAPEHPVVFFMDDVHWADRASLDLFESLFMDHTIRSLILVGTYRDNEVDAAHPLIRTIEKIKNIHGTVESIKLENLDVRAVAQIISDIVSRPEQEVGELAGIVHERTLGNPFYTIEFLKYCNDNNLLYYDQDEIRWKWNAAGIGSSKISDNVADYLIGKIETLPAATRELIKIAACVGNRFDIKVLSAVAGKDTGKVKDELKPAIREEMVYVAERKEAAFEELQFEFCHDRFQQAGYQALSNDAKKIIHLKIANYYEAAEVLEGTNLFVVADHLAKALDALVSTREIKKAIEIFFMAAQTANRSSAYDTARQYLELIINIAPDDLKKDDSFRLRIYTEYHLALFSLARFEELDQIYIKVAELCRDPLDLVDCCCLQLISLSNRSRYQEGFFLGVSLLEKLGVNYPGDELKNVIEAEYEKYCQCEENGTINRLDEKEALGDKRGKAIAKILNRIVAAGLFYNPMTSFWATLINTNQMIEKGITGEALEMSLGLIMGIIAYKHDFYRGNLLIKKALSIVERDGLFGELYRMYHINGLVRCHWFEPVEQDIYYAHEAYKGNLQNGEFEFACYSYFTSQAAILECCNSISEMQEEVEAAIFFASRMGNLYGLESFVNYRQIVRALRGKTLCYGSFNDEYFNEEKHVEEVQANSIGLAYHYIYRSLSAVLFSDFETAFTLTEKAIPLLPYFASFYPAALLRFLHSLSICKTIEAVPMAEKQEQMKHILTENQRWLYQRAQDAPFNFQHLHDLVEAEINALEGRYDESFRLYEKAVSGAKDHKRPYHYALACELAGQRYHQTGIKRIAGFYLKEAYSAYLAWGATGKTEAMKEEYPDIIFSGIESAKLLRVSSDPAGLTSSTDISALTNSMDMNAVIKATQMISGEIGKKKLLEKLMTIIIENSGSNRGYILTRDENIWLLSAYECANNAVKIIFDDQEIILEETDTQISLPISIFSYVMRTKEPVIIASIPASRFSTDKYFSENTTSSVMCFPILLHNALKGLVYLENDLLTEAFSHERLEVLNIFASQAAISLENSILYSELEEKVRKRTIELLSTNSILKERTAELAVAKEIAETANQQLEAQNFQLQHEIIIRKQVEEEQRLNMEQLRLSEERFVKIFHNSPIMMSIITLDEDNYIDVNKKWEETTGFRRQEIIGRAFSDLAVWAEIGQLPEATGELDETGVKKDAEITIRTKSGEIRTIFVSRTVVSLNNEDCWLIASVDITERKKMEQEMARLDRLNLVGEMAASIGHEIRNPMTTVRGYLQFLQQDKDYHKEKESFDLMIEELDSANSIITEFLSLAKNKTVERTPTNLNTIIGKLLPLVQAKAVSKGQHIKVELDDLPDLLLDNKEIRQLILNLVNNGMESMAGAGEVTIRTFIENGELVLAVQDQGNGIDSKLLDKIGTPFFTTKEQGTGLGMAVCYRIANRHNAQIDIDTGSTGTTFYIRFQNPSVSAAVDERRF